MVQDPNMADVHPRIKELEKKIQLLEYNQNLLITFLQNPVNASKLRINAVGKLIIPKY